MKVIVVCGPPGSGKTTLIKKRFPDTPHLDMDTFRNDAISKGYTGYDVYSHSMETLFSTIESELQKDSNLIIVEGIFAPGSHSRGWLRSKLWSMKLDIDEYIVPDFTFGSASVNLVKDFHEDGDEERLNGRVAMLIKYGKSFK